MQGKSSRTINLNTNYIILFKNPRDKYQVYLLARQMFPGQSLPTPQAVHMVIF